MNLHNLKHLPCFAYAAILLFVWGVSGIYFLLHGKFAFPEYAAMLSLRKEYEYLIAWHKPFLLTKDRYLVTAYPSTSTNYEYDEILSLKKFLDEHGINLIYVNKPLKYMDDDSFYHEFGIKTHGNENADKLLARIRNAGINVIDLRDNIRQEGLDPHTLFYRTDHHWTTTAGLWASGIIADGLNRYCGYHIPMSLYDESNYTFRYYPQCWLGEQGRDIGARWTGLDDYVSIKPAFPSNCILKTENGRIPASFDDFIDHKILNARNDIYMDESLHYSYKWLDCINLDATEGKVLLLGDSYDHVVIPFLSLGIHELDSILLRDKSENFDVRNHILEQGYDTVIISYAESMIGAHDDPESANYRMFAFDR